MATLTYTDLHGGAPVISWHGREFTSTVPVEVDPEKDGGLIEAAKGNRFFKYEDGKAPKHDETIVGKGEAAAREGKKRLIPPAYRGDDKKPQADAWLYGYDRVPQSDDPYAEPGEEADKPTPPAAPAATQVQPQPQPQQAAQIAKAGVTSAAPVSPTQALQTTKQAE